ncbi:MAG: hypothetical protein NTW30_01785 [Candidatus Aenigmarchaeota archaeon]|nr:hypothetical protein [Candidatus Aenigmarchaeota archaeon]
MQVEVQAVGLGTLTKNIHSQVMRGESVKFTILLWNSENSSFPVKLRATQIPEGLSVIVNPKGFMMNFSRVDGYSNENGIEYINTPYGLMKTFPVDVLVKTSNSIDLGKYDVYVNLAAGESTTGISTIFEKTFRFDVEVVSYINRPKMTETTIQNFPILNENIAGKTTGMFSKVSIDTRLIFIVSLMIGIFLVAWTIYKHE